MSEVKVGQVYKDNDYRMPGRTLVVEDIVNGKAHMRTLTGTSYLHRSPVMYALVSLSRLHTDHKTRRTGFSLVKP